MLTDDVECSIVHNFRHPGYLYVRPNYPHRRPIPMDYFSVAGAHSRSIKLRKYIYRQHLPWSQITTYIRTGGKER